MHVEECCQALLAHLLPIIDEKREGICIDVGVGTFTFYCELFADLGFKTFAVEPLPCNTLQQMCQFYGITLFENCLADINGVQTLHIGTFQGNDNLNLCSLEKDWWGASTKTVQVECLTLNKLLSDINTQKSTQKITCLKLDIEGAELTVIRQLLELPESLLPSVVMFEYGGGDNRETGEKGWSQKFLDATLECLEILKLCGYSFSLIIEASKEATESIFDLQKHNLDPDQIFNSQAIWGNIISFRNFSYPSQQIQELCLPFVEKNDSHSNGINLIKNSGEIQIIEKFISSGSIVFDIGANRGDWTKEVLNKYSDVHIHLFEPVVKTYHILLQNLADSIKFGQVIPNNFAVSYKEKAATFFYYENHSSLSTFHRRLSVEKPLNLEEPKCFTTLTTTIDEYCKHLNVKQINFLKIDTEGGELDVLKGAKQFLKRGKIDYLQFEYGGTFLDAGITLEEIVDFLHNYRYSIFKILSNGLEYQPQYLPEHENFEYSNFLAVNERFISTLLGHAPTMLDLQELCVQHSVVPRGVIYIGGYEGKEIECYQKMGVQNIFFIEANPDIWLQKLELDTAEFNILNMDIQGAELLALQGTSNLLKYVDAINTKVNYEELYQDCALIDQVDDFLENHGFERVATTSPYHPSWGDAFYVRMPVITMSTLGKNGRFANQIFQYAFLKIYAKEHNLRVETPTWIGQYLFGHSEPPISKQFPLVIEETNELSEACIPAYKEGFHNVDFWGYFQYNTKYYAPHKEYFRSLFKPVPELERKMTAALERLRSRGKTVVGLHLRRGDYGYEYFFVAPNEWYIDWLKGLWETLEEPVLFIASDEPETVIGDFVEYNPITSQDLGIGLSEAQFYPDFYLLSQCDIVAISNSSFSFVACMLNEQGKFFFRPHLQSEKLIPFDPWNSETILRNVKPIDYPLTSPIKSEVEEREAKRFALLKANLLPLKLRSVNLIIFPDWSQPEELLFSELGKVIETILSHPDKIYMTLLVESSSLSEEEAELVLSSIVMNLFWQEDLDVTNEPEIALIPKLRRMQWEALLPSLHGRIILENENKQMIAQVLTGGNFPSFEIDSINSQRATRFKNFRDES
ncbi:MAG: FkbM family methyltransferase [Coleofasciculus sp. B1-GNL1-01]|uniref:FkbM family methyltransferase n=1 Tax=Coleofasciculus sp. B1-GNL1-01 TaxID=3068484 RepID=UPI0032F8CC3F